jgi:biopolymer transport protein ExbD
MKRLNTRSFQRLSNDNEPSMNRKRALITASIPTASMADIAFLLIIFFLVTTTLSQDKGLGLTLPPSGMTATVPERNITTVLITGLGEISLDGQRVTLDELGSRIKTLTRDNPNIIVSIKTAPDARYQIFVDVVDEIKKAGNDKISIAKPDEQTG